MYIFDLTNGVTLVLVLIVTILLIFLGKEVKKPQVPAVALVAFLMLILIHSIQLANLQPEFEHLKTMLISCVGIDLVMIFISFISYLWIDDIACKFYKKKSIDNSLDWFWGKV